MQYQEESRKQYDSLTSDINYQSAYKKKAASDRTTMSVKEMGDLLGIKKTERYWLIHKGYFKTVETAGKMRVDLESFEKWYANQIRYRKATGEEPGKELRLATYSAKEISEMLKVSDYGIYEWLDQENISYSIVGNERRYSIAEVNEHIRAMNYIVGENVIETMKDLADLTISVSEMARMLGIMRETALGLTMRLPEAFDTLRIGYMTRITWESYNTWLNSQTQFHTVADRDNQKDAAEPNYVEVLQRKAIKSVVKTQKKILTVAEAAILANTSTSTVSKWIAAHKCPFLKAGNMIRIPREDFVEWLQQTDRMEG